MRVNYTTFPQVVKALGVTYSKVMHAVTSQRVVEPRRVGCYRLFSPAQVETLKAHFHKPASE
jgi:DNA-binding transcriptional MerR regulator